MDQLIIEGGQSLNGEIQVSGAKNAALPLLFASLLCEGTSSFENIPNLADIETTFKILTHLGAKVDWNKDKHTATIDASSIGAKEAPYELVRTMRASVLVLGPLLSRFGEAKVSLPGGCSIGTRPVDLHLMALEKLGATITIDGGYIHAKASKLKGATITFPIISVGATENTLMAAATAEGETLIENAAMEPEIVDLAKLLQSMGVIIDGAGTPRIKIKGVNALKSPHHRVIADRIEAGTYLAAVATVGGHIKMPGVTEDLFRVVIDKFKESGVNIISTPTGIEASFDCRKQPLKCVDITTKEFPGFPTDMQAQFMTAMCVGQGSSLITETIFENRFMHVPELMRLGADVKIQGKSVVVRGKGPWSLSGATVMATDLRASASLVLAGLAAEGKTTVRRIYHLDRGYECMEAKLAALGAKINRSKQ